MQRTQSIYSSLQETNEVWKISQQFRIYSVHYNDEMCGLQHMYDISHIVLLQVIDLYDF